MQKTSDPVSPVETKSTRPPRATDLKRLHLGGSVSRQSTTAVSKVQPVKIHYKETPKAVKQYFPANSRRDNRGYQQANPTSPNRRKTMQLSASEPVQESYKGSSPKKARKHVTERQALPRVRSARPTYKSGDSWHCLGFDSNSSSQHRRNLFGLSSTNHSTDSWAGLTLHSTAYGEEAELKDGAESAMDASFATSTTRMSSFHDHVEGRSLEYDSA